MSLSLVAPAELLTARLRLRKPTLADANPLFRAYATDEEVVRFLIWTPHRSVTDTRDYLKHCLGEWSTGNSFPYVIESLDSQSGPIGMIDLRKRPHGMDFGYVLARSHWGQGFMSEALTAVVDWSLDQPDIWRASAICDVDNGASARVMEKAGMSFEGILRRYFVHPNVADEPRDCRMYAKVRG